jgi:hypothetical protein
MPTHFQPIVALLTVAVVAPAGAAVIFQDDFESYTVGQTLPSGSPYDTNGGSNITVESSGVFGQGGTNNYLQFDDDPGDGSVRATINNGIAAGTGGLLSYEVDYFEQDVASRDDPFNLRLADGGNPTDVAVDVNLSNGVISVNNGGTGLTIGSYSLDSIVSLTVNVDETTETFEVFADGSQLSGVVGGTSVSTFGFRNSGIDIDRFQFGSFGSNVQFAAIDNLVVRDEFTVIPEPASAAALGLLGLVGLRRRR